MIPRVLLILTVVASTADAQLFRKARARPAKFTEEVVLDDALEVQTLFLVAPPSYYGTPQYTPPAVASQRSDAAATQKALVDTLAKIVETLAIIERRLAAVETRARRPPAVPSIPLVVIQQCGACHGAEPKGGFMLAELSQPNRNLMARALVANGKMPLDAAGNVVELTPQKRAGVLAALATMERK